MDLTIHTPLDSTNLMMFVDDDEDDILLFSRALGDSGVEFQLVIAHDGKEAIEYLLQPNKSLFPLPRWIITDIKMPLLTGFQLLQRVKESELKKIPVVLLSSSSHPDDLFRAYSNGADGYLVKPSHLDGMKQLWQALRNYCDGLGPLANDELANFLPTGSKSSDQS